LKCSTLEDIFRSIYKNIKHAKPDIRRVAGAVALGSPQNRNGIPKFY
jgi:hypothetical protein